MFHDLFTKFYKHNQTFRGKQISRNDLQHEVRQTERGCLCLLCYKVMKQKGEDECWKEAFPVCTLHPFFLCGLFVFKPVCQVAFQLLFKQASTLTLSHRPLSTCNLSVEQVSGWLCLHMYETKCFYGFAYVFFLESLTFQSEHILPRSRKLHWNSQFIAQATVQRLRV